MAAIDPMTSEARRFSIRLPRPLWVGLVAVVMIVAYAGLRIGTPIYRQELAIQHLNQAGAYMLTNERGPAWLRRWIGRKRMRGYNEVVSVELSGDDADDHLIATFKSLKNLKWVSLKQSRVTDAGLAQVKGITTLETLEIESLLITDAGLLNLYGLPNLRILKVQGTQLTDAGISELKRSLPMLIVRK